MSGDRVNLNGCMGLRHVGNVQSLLCWSQQGAWLRSLSLTHVLFPCHIPVSHSHSHILTITGERWRGFPQSECIWWTGGETQREIVHTIKLSTVANNRLSVAISLCMYWSLTCHQQINVRFWMAVVCMSTHYLLLYFQIAMYIASLIAINFICWDWCIDVTEAYYVFLV